MINSESKRGRFGKKTIIAAVLGGALFMSACHATTAGRQIRPTVYAQPMQGQSSEQIYQDDSYCRYYASTQSRASSNIIVQDTLGGAGIGALAGGAFDGWRGAGRGAAIGAGLGLLFGLLSQAQHSQSNLYDINRAYAYCMQGRGYSVR